MWSNCNAFVVPTLESCTSNIDSNCDGRFGCNGVVKSSIAASTSEDDAIFGVATAYGNNGFDGAAYGVGYRSANAASDGTPSSAKVLVLKQETNGDPTDWSYKFNIGASGHAYARAVAVSAQEDVIIVGVYQEGSLSIEGQGLPTAGVEMRSFIASFTATGSLRFAQSLGTNGTTMINDVGVDGNGNIFVGGQFNAPIDFGNGIVMPAGIDGFIASYSDTGSLRWKQIFSGAGDQSVDVLSVDTFAKIYTATNFTGVIDIPGGPAITSDGQSDGLITAFHPNSGAVLWNNQAGGSGNAAVTAMASRGGNLAVAVAFQGDLGFGPANHTNPEIDGASDTLMATLETDGGAVMASNPIGGTGMQLVKGMDLDSFGDIVTAGLFWTSLPLAGLTDLTTNGTDVNAFVIKFGPNLAPYWGYDYGDTQTQAFLDVAIEHSTGHIFPGGAFQGAMTGFGLIPIQSTTGFDALFGTLSN